MNLPLAFLHGEWILVPLGLAVLIALIGVPLVLYIWLWRTKISELKLAIGYLLFVAVLCFMFGSSGPANPASILWNTASALGFILTLPWNLLATWVFSNLRGSEVSDHDIAIMMLLGGGVNAVLLYLIAIKLRRLIR